ncbi:DUF2603 domain-containing protein [Helicobacter sp. MIT 21-1697]|uniref:DUF2603 domain-containing protein n=1 Tax=Helicobacter sp. MIT 21-1697 TaxID=2993733 RepID=UPI00224AE886|nr:DUF2603 domain-containing protein [Helicobacter sp. MIT 21-1697]MCX2717782.1 DUF2603 domain-containing protein [Helicobacter sp. MIT 21-1697]
MKISEQEKWQSGENLGILRKLEDNTMLLAMESGGFSKEDLWFLQDEQGEEYVVFPQKLFVQLLSHIKNIQEEKLVMRLEKDIVSQMPIDFDDAMAVAKNALESLRLNDGNLPEVNTTTLAKDIKKRYPNLFFDIDYLRKSK